MKDFFQIQSLGQYSVEAHVEDWIDAPNTEEYYSFGNFALTSNFAEVANGSLE